jgi:hypothetical protein
MQHGLFFRLTGEHFVNSPLKFLSTLVNASSAFGGWVLATMREFLGHDAGEFMGDKIQEID